MTIALKTKFITGDKRPYVERPCKCGEVYIRLWKGKGKYKCKCGEHVDIKPISKRFTTGRSY